MPIGITNNNPTNLRPGPAWNGLANPPESGGFSVFVSPVMGIRAAAKSLRSYGRLDPPLNTNRLIWEKWAPAGNGNDPIAYAQFVSTQTGFGIDQVLITEDQPTLVALIKASTLMENGRPPAAQAASNGNWYSDAIFAEGVAAAFA